MPATAASSEPLRLLFVKERMAWPRASGHDVHTYYMMQALAAQGHSIALATMEVPNPAAVADGALEEHFCFAEPRPAMPRGDLHLLALSKWEEKFRNYWGIDADAIRWVGACAAEFRADAVVVSGLRVLPYLGALPHGTQAVWYAADEWVLHHISQVRLLKPRTWGELRQAIDKGLYERAYRKRLDRVWVVSKSDARAFRWFAGINQVDVLPNGVDAEHYAPGPEEPLLNSCVFWGRLDFGPNVQALEWFLGKVWPRVRAKIPNARFDVFGFQPTAEVISLCKVAGVTLTADRPDIRAEVRTRQVVVLPFTSGGGIKNKLLEAAAMGRPVLATPRVIAGLNAMPPFPTAKSPQDFAEALLGLFGDESRRASLGRAARAWVSEHHTWAAAARIAAGGLTAIKRMPSQISIGEPGALATGAVSKN
jgi:glycosyltransferase involved in cell wall biosynthesis